MSFAIHVDRIALGDNLRERLSLAMTGSRATARAEEVDQARRRALDARRAAGHVLSDVLAEKKIAEDRARMSAATAERMMQRTASARLLLKEAEEQTPAVTDAVVRELTQAQVDEKLALADARTHEQAAVSATERALQAVPDSEVAHVGDVFDAFVESAIDQLVISASTLAKLGVTSVQVEVSGHVEDQGAQGSPGFFGVRAWPVV